MTFAGPVAVHPVAPHGILIDHPIHFPFPPLPASLPLAGSKNGNLFVDRNDSNLHWYLPDFALADDVDPSFAFAASQQGQQANGQPFNTAKLTLRISKLRPVDATQFGQANPNAKLQEIPLPSLAAVLTSPYTDQNGQQQERTFSSSSFTDLGDGSFAISFDGSILGDSVVGLYQDLRALGHAVLNLSATFQTWSDPVAPQPPGNLNWRMLALPARSLVPPEAVPQVGPGPSPAAHMSPIGTLAFAPAAASLMTSPPPSPPNLIQLPLPYAKTLPLGLKYNADGYQLRYTISTTGTPSHVILSVNDLNSFNETQSQFAELKKLGDLSTKYPSLSRAYFGVLSRTIVLIPQRYSIVRGKTGCSATCLARVDSSSASASRCAFEFTFVVAPEVNRIEFAKLKNEVAANPDLGGYTLTFPAFLRANPPSSVITTFKSDAQFVPGSDAHTFIVNVSVQDDGPNTPAVANANLFILRLCSQKGADLIGSMSLKLDEGFSDPVQAPIDLNFSHTTGTDELVAAFDDASSTLRLSNVSPLDLQIQDYALIQNSSLSEVPGAFTLAANSAKSLPLPADHSNMDLLAVAQLALPAQMSNSTAATFMNFQTIDVQQTQYVVAVDAAGVDFAKVASITASITFPTLPSIAPFQLTLNSTNTADSRQVKIPIENAVFSLPGSVDLFAQFVDSSLNPVEFTVENDFTKEPVLSILQSDIASRIPST